MKSGKKPREVWIMSKEVIELIIKNKIKSWEYKKTLDY